MTLERTTPGASLLDVLDRVLDQGIVIDAWVRFAVVGIDLLTIEARVVVASIETYLQFSDAVAPSPTALRRADRVIRRKGAHRPALVEARSSHECQNATSAVTALNAGRPAPIDGGEAAFRLVVVGIDCPRLVADVAAVTGG